MWGKTAQALHVEKRFDLKDCWENFVKIQMPSEQLNRHFLPFPMTEVRDSKSLWILWTLWLKDIYVDLKSG